MLRRHSFLDGCNSSDLVGSDVSFGPNAAKEFQPEGCQRWVPLPGVRRIETALAM